MQKKAGIGLAIILVGVVICVMGTEWSVRQTVQWHYELLRDTAGNTASPIDLTNAEGDFTSKPADAVHLRANDASGMSQNAVAIIFCGTDMDDGGDATFSWTLYGWRCNNGPAELIAVGTGILGTQDVVKYPHDGTTATLAYWADTLVITTDYWIAAVCVSTAGGDNIAKLTADFGGYAWLRCEISGAGGGAAAESITVYYSYF